MARETKEGGFMTFIREHGVIALAIGLAIGTQVGKAVEAIVEGLVNPIVGYIVGNQEGLQAAKWTVVHAATKSDRGLTIYWGQVLSALITLLAVSAVIYYVIHGMRLDRIDRKQEK